MSQRKSISLQILASIFAAAGIQMSANACESTQPAFDERTATQIVRALAGTNAEVIEKILQAESMDDLTPEQREKLFSIVKESAKRLNRSTPIA
jgi:hypothetical protein